jgi:hypothetical protein
MTQSRAELASVCGNEIATPIVSMMEGLVLQGGGHVLHCDSWFDSRGLDRRVSFLWGVWCRWWRLGLIRACEAMQLDTFCLPVATCRFVGRRVV